MRRAGLSAAVSAATLLSLASPAAAEQDADARARTLFEEGTRLVDAGDLAGALNRYRAAYDVVPRAMLLRNIGAVLVELDRRAEAANAFAEYLAQADVEPEWIAEVERVLGKLDMSLGRLRLRVEGAPVSVRLDGVPVGASPLERLVRVDPGTHLVAVVRENRDRPERKTWNIAVAAGAEVELALGKADLWPEAASPPPPATSIGGQVDAPGPALAIGVSAFVRVDVDLTGRGAVGAPGAGVRFGERLDLFGNALVGADGGAEIGARYGPRLGALRPLVTLSLPVFFHDGAYANLRGGIGGEWTPLSWLSAAIDVGLAYAFSPPEDVVRTVPIGSARVAFDF
jgi:hypothetical protein